MLTLIAGAVGLPMPANRTTRLEFCPTVANLTGSDELKVARSYEFALPLVLMGATLDVSLRMVQDNYLNVTRDTFVNTFAHVLKFPTPDFRGVVNPNVDTLYSSAFLDVGQEPVVLTIPKADHRSRYGLFQIMDFWTNVIGNPELLYKEQVVCISLAPHLVSDDYTPCPDDNMNITIVSNTTNLWLLGRTAPLEGGDLVSTNALQLQYQLRGLSSDDPNPAWDSSADSSLSARDIVNSMSALEFFGNATQLMVDNKPTADDAPFMADVWPVVEESSEATLMAGAEKAGTLLQCQALNLTEWTEEYRLLRWPIPRPRSWLGISGSVGTYGTDYPVRAVIADVGLGANLPEDAVYFVKPFLFGGCNYTLTLSPPPPVDSARGFWSITTYVDQYLVADPRNGTQAAVVSSLQNDIVIEKNGNAVIYIQASDPGEGKNWLYVPEDVHGTNLTLTARFYLPTAEIYPDRTWTPPMIELSRSGPLRRPQCQRPWAD